MSIDQTSQKKFGTFLGVFTPSVLTILGLIMYLRFGWVVGNVGLGYTILIVVMASSITFITGLSASAIATNMLVGAGGEYYMVSRSLGIEPGGAIGIPLYFCRTLSVTFYCFGMAEALILFWPESWGVVPWYAIQGITAIIIILITILSGRSAELVLKSQIPIIILVGLSILALFIGVLSGPLQAPNFTATYESAPEGFWYVFAVFFPAVTGFTAGIGMSGDLKDPKKSIPIGTLGAVLTCLIIYLLIPVAMASSAQLPTNQLIDASVGSDNWTSVALFGSLFIVPAVLGAILSSAFGSILNGPRVLQALSADGLAPKTFSTLSKSGQPTRATYVTGLIALLAVLLGELNTVAILVSVLFLTLYVAINLSAAIEVIVAEPHYRPKIKVPWMVSILGAIGAIFVMFLISPIACIVALGIELAIYFYLRRKSLEQNWGDVNSGILLNIAKRALLNHSKKKINPRNWRPQILLFTKNVSYSMPLVKLGAAISENKGILTLCQLVKTDEQLSFDDRENLRVQMQTTIQNEGIEAFCEVNVVPKIKEGMLQIASAHGIAGLKSNTIVEGVSETDNGRITQLRNLNQMAQAGKNLILAKFNANISPNSLEDKIIIWWAGQEKNADLMLLIAYLIQLNVEFKNTQVEIVSIIQDKSIINSTKLYIESKLANARIKAQVHILYADNLPHAIIKKHSRNAKLVMLGLPLTQTGQEKQKVDWLMDISDSIATTLFVYNAGMSNAVPRLLIPKES